MIGIVAHTSRAQQARDLQESVKAGFVSIDNGAKGCDGNHRYVQERLARADSAWSVILEDDAVPVDGFTDQLREALKVAPSPVVSLYLGRMRPTWAQNGVVEAIANATDADWLMSDFMLHAVGYAIRTDLLPSLLEFFSTMPADQKISAWAQHHRHPVAYCWPSLLDHHDGPTTVAHPDGHPRTPGRVAWKAAPHRQWSSRTAPLRIP